MKNQNYPKGRNHKLVIQEFEKELLIYDLQTNKAYCLNETSALVWQESDGTKTITEISRTLTEKLHANVSEDIVWLALDQLKKDHLLDENINFKSPFDGLNRREIVKKIGLSTMVALPIISSLVAPTAANALSTNCVGVFFCLAPNNLTNANPNGCPCAVNGDCTGDCIGGICLNGTNQPICAPPNNLGNVSADCCPCAVNGDCVNNCVGGICAP